MKISPKNLFILLLLGPSFLFILPANAQAQCGGRLLGFYTDYNYSYRSDKIPYNHLTHIAHAFLNINSDGSISVPPGHLEPALNSNAHANGVKVLASIGGANVTTFSGVAANAAYTATFVDQLYQFILNNNYDGVDIDWEFPNTNNDKIKAVPFFQAIRNKFDSSPYPAPTWEISFDVEAGYWSTWIDYPNLVPYVSFFNQMSYGGAGSWTGHSCHNSPLYIGSDPTTSDETDQGDIDYLISQGVPASKINLGMPFNGVLFPNANGIYAACGCSNLSNPTYSQISAMIGSPWTYNWDAGSQVPYLTNGPGNTGFLTYEDSQSVSIKTNYALSVRKIGGVFMWELSGDYMSNGTQPLLDSMYSSFQANGPPTCTPTITPTPIPTATPYVIAPLPPVVIYPNPVTIGNSFTLQLPMTGPSDVKVQLFSVAFRKVQEQDFSQLLPGGVCRCVNIPVTVVDNWQNNLSNGLYYLVETTTDGIFTQKLLILK